MENECGARNMARNMAAIDKSDPLYEAFRRGKELEREMLKAEGGTLTGKQFSERLGILTYGSLRLFLLHLFLQRIREIQ